MAVNPPPSLWVEVDKWGRSAAKLPLYAGLGVPEVWRYRARKQTLWIGTLDGPSYAEAPASLALPGLTPAVILEALAGAAARSATEWKAWLDGELFPRIRADAAPG